MTPDKKRFDQNKFIELEIEDTLHDGNGIAHCGEYTVFCERAVKGDRLRARVTAEKKNILFARIEALIVPSPLRTEPDCAVFNQCGGCTFRHIGYAEELRLKQNFVASCLKKIAHIELEPEPIIGSPEIDGYRNKAQYPAAMENGRLKIGFYAPGSHTVIDSRSCRLQPACFETALRVFEHWIKENGVSIYDEKTGRGLLRHIYLRQAASTKELMACAVINGEIIPAPARLAELLKQSVPGFVSLIVNVNKAKTNVILGEKCKTVWGKGSITDRFCGLNIEISPLSFYQVNSRQAETLYRTAAEMAGLDKTQTIWDLYCGAGTIGLYLSRFVKNVVGVEIVEQAVSDAKRNAKLNSVENIEFLCGDAFEMLKQFSRSGNRPDAVVVDPPRKGIGEAAVNEIASIGPEKIIYISCNPATLARDIAWFSQKGYLCRQARPVDMFPRTTHVETVVLMSRVDK